MKLGWAGSLICGIAEDISVQKQAEQERLARAIHQRDVLVREVHHRIKNNLQGVAGLLRQKIRKFPAVAPGIEEAIVQLQAVACGLWPAGNPRGRLVEPRGNGGGDLRFCGEPHGGAGRPEFSTSRRGQRASPGRRRCPWPCAE